jgi:peptide-methionine (R)-S-oxide reductase
VVKIRKSEDDWRRGLTPEQYRVLRQKGTEPAFSSDMEFNFDKGTYMCGACKAPLFSSNTKFDAHCGWPSFYDAMPGAVEFHKDVLLGAERTEVTCATCGSHLGHVFEDEGFVNPTNKRYCINSLSLQFEKDKK